jgi:hypothetical protein
MRVFCLWLTWVDKELPAHTSAFEGATRGQTQIFTFVPFKF